MKQCAINDEICCGNDCRCESSCCDYDVTTIKNFVKIISQKWSLKIINVLNEQECGFNELHYHLKECTRKVLTEALNNLIKRNIFDKKIYLKNNVTYLSYRLTDIGFELIRMLYQIKWFSCVYLACLKIQNIFFKILLFSYIINFLTNTLYWKFQTICSFTRRNFLNVI